MEIVTIGMESQWKWTSNGPKGPRRSAVYYLLRVLHVCTSVHLDMSVRTCFLNHRVVNVHLLCLTLL